MGILCFPWYYIAVTIFLGFLDYCNQFSLKPFISSIILWIKYFFHMQYVVCWKFYVQKSVFPDAYFQMLLSCPDEIFCVLYDFVHETSIIWLSYSQFPYKHNINRKCPDYKKLLRNCSLLNEMCLYGVLALDQSKNKLFIQLFFSDKLHGTLFRRFL